VKVNAVKVAFGLVGECCEVGHFALHHRAGLPLRWIEYRANGPACQGDILPTLAQKP
jgi:hypothetical protein